MVKTHTMNRSHLLLVLYVAGFCGCYPKFQDYPHTPTLVSGGAAPEVKQFIKDSVNACDAKLHDARLAAYTAHKNQYQAGVFGSIVTLSTGSVAGGSGLGAGLAGSKGAAYISLGSGVLALASGIVSLVMVNTQDINSSEQQQSKMFAVYTAMASAQSAYASALVGGTEQARKDAFADFVKAVSDCGVALPPQRLQMLRTLAGRSH